MLSRRRATLVVCSLVACASRPTSFGAPDASPSSPSTSTSSSSPCSDSPYTIDGQFTGFLPSANPRVGSMFAGTYEWAGVPSIRGKYTYMSMAACSTGNSDVLYFINDWYTNAKGAIEARCYNRFDFFDPASQDAIELRVYGDHHVAVFENGANAAFAAKGAAGFTSSPNVGAPHSIFEFSLELPWKYQSVQLSASDPCGSSPPPAPPTPVDGPTPPSVGVECEDPSYMIDEPVSAQLDFGGGKLLSSVAPDVPRATGLDKYDAAPGDRVVLRGRRFGATPGFVSVDGRDAKVLVWTDTRIQIIVPDGVSANAKTKVGAGGWTVDGPRIVGPAPPAN